MLSLGLVTPSKNTLTSEWPKPSRSRGTGAQPHPLSPFRSQKLQEPVRTTTSAKTAVREHVQEENSRDGNALARDSPDVEPFPEELREELMPKHVAVIMDGNGRWARQRGLPPSAGHEAGARSLRELVELCCKWGIRVLTVFAFSYDNWIRPKVRLLHNVASSIIDFK